MDHVAIMKKSWGLTGKILDGRKKIESRWYAARREPWNPISKGDTVYFKDSGEPVRLKAGVRKVMRFSELTPGRVRNILFRYGKADGLEEKDVPKFYELFRKKKYCLLIFLEKPQPIAPFEIDKRGFGAMAAWLVAEKISKIKA